MQHISIGSGPKKTAFTRTSLLSMYFDPPTEELTMDEFELISLDRLQLLRTIELYKQKGFDEKDFNAKVSAAEKKHLLNKKDHRLSDEKRDVVGHFILRLAYCKTEDLRRWFITQECSLFKNRLDLMTDEERQMFMAQNGLHFDIISEEDKKRRSEKLIGLSDVTEGSFIRTTFYRIPFVQALQLIGTRSVYLEGGYAYVPLNKLVSIIITRVRIFEALFHSSC